ncbi:MAG TPA: hypothetical protein VNO50_18305 [Pyrinomonadaceae bacterium]|nr:hypothetical protein [Pyrinomonadaceae bacterium]
MQISRNLFTGLGKTFGSRWCGFLIGGVGVGAALYYLLGVRNQADRQLSVKRKQLGDNVVDDRGTDQDKASRILVNLRNRAFESSDERLALALGRPTEEVAAWQAGLELIDDDVIMKARGIAMHRGVSVE